MTRRVRGLAVAIAVAAGAVGAIGIASPAMAASASCKIPINSLSCNSGTIAAASGPGDRNFIDYHVCGLFGGTNWAVRDRTTGVEVGRGVANGGCVSGRIRGLYGTAYRLELRGFPNSTGSIDNV